jgi:peptidase E
MRKIGVFIILLAAWFAAGAQPNAGTVARTIFITGGNFSKPFIKYVIGLTKKENPKICFVPTASADNPNGIVNWFETCADLPMRAYVQKVFLNSAPGQKTFEENLLGMDAIIVGGGSTLNMMAIWKAQGIDTVLRKAYDKGIVLAGGSAGSLCWFTGGFTDSRPQKLSLVSCLGFIGLSHCPHFHSEPTRKPLYEDAVLKGVLQPGYACDDAAGLLFQNEKVIKCVSIDSVSHAYYISAVDGKIKEELLNTDEIIK